MTLATETDPREVCRLILDTNEQASASDYTNAAPTNVEVVEASTLNEKVTRARAAGEDALYIWRPADGSIEKFGVDGSTAIRRPAARVECYAPKDGDVEALKEDVISIAAGYASDNKASTAFVDIWPESEVDTRHESNPQQGDAAIEAVVVRFVRDDAV